MGPAGVGKAHFFENTFYKCVVVVGTTSELGDFGEIPHQASVQTSIGPTSCPSIPTSQPHNLVDCAQCWLGTGVGLPPSAGPPVIFLAGNFRSLVLSTMSCGCTSSGDVRVDTGAHVVKAFNLRQKFHVSAPRAEHIPTADRRILQ